MTVEIKTANLGFLQEPAYLSAASFIHDWGFHLKFTVSLYPQCLINLEQKT